MIMGFANFHRLVRDNPDIAFIAHPTMGGAARIAPPLLLGKLFRLLGPTRWCSPTMADASATPQIPAVRSRGGAGGARTGCAPACRCRPAA